MKVRFVAAAKAGLDAILRYYEKQPPGLGADFLDEVTSAVNQIAEFPDAWQLLEPEIRRYRINRFPYGIVHTQRGNHIVVLAVAHLHQKPKRWHGNK